MTIVYAHYLATWFLPQVGEYPRHAARGLRFFGGAMTLNAAQVLVWYLAHSGTASIQIAGMRAIGWEVPERYHYPFLARSPEDFWRRWNIYLGSWMYKYVFIPVGVPLLRRRPAGAGSREKAVAVMATFGVCGLAHELCAYMRFHRLIGGALLGFLMAGALVVVWVGVAQVWKARSRNLSGAAQCRTERVAGALSPVAMVCAALLVGAIFLPGLGGMGPWTQVRLLFCAH